MRANAVAGNESVLHSGALPWGQMMPSAALGLRLSMQQEDQQALVRVAIVADHSAMPPRWRRRRAPIDRRDADAVRAEPCAIVAPSARTGSASFCRADLLRERSSQALWHRVCSTASGLARRSVQKQKPTMQG
mmetsp:Transcript_29880/g.86855  ORF Transcript_29880/g.86855 Transcript_29880/m.86855 type:complete len:133 (-) Transcript_29880:671-1069(-)